MSVKAKSVLEQALQLSQQERSVVAEGLLSSLDRPDPTIDELWAEEAEARIGAAERGGMETVSEQEVFGKYENRCKFASTGPQSENLTTPSNIMNTNFLA